MTSLWAAPAASFSSRNAAISVEDLQNGSTLGPCLESMRGRSVLLAVQQQLTTAALLIELDGVARRMVVCTPDLSLQQLAAIAAHAAAEAVVIDDAAGVALPIPSYVAQTLPKPPAIARDSSECTEWVLLTSGTTGSPKLVLHTLVSLAGALPTVPATATVWSTFYDIRRYGGLQIYLRAVLGGSSLVLSSPGETVQDFLARAGERGVTHISGTPSHWRGVLMSGAAGLIAPQYVRLSGEVADQALLDRLRAAYPDARIDHAFASTEAGVAFEVSDGLAGFPSHYLQGRADVEMKLQDGTLRIRSGRTASRYVGPHAERLAIEDGYVDTGDRVELLDERCYFRGRAGGVINVGGLKVHPEEVEAVVNADPRVRMCWVSAKRNPITGSVVIADVVLADPHDAAGSAEAIKAELLAACRLALAAHKVPAIMRFVPSLPLSAAGKLVRPDA